MADVAELDQEHLTTAELPVPVGAAAGFGGALATMIVIGLILIASGQGIFTAARMIASVVMGESAQTGILSVLIGTGIHLTTGTVLGAVFAWLMPRTYRTIWLVAGLIYGFVAWLIAYFVVLSPLFPFVRSTNTAYALLLAHVIYGALLGIIGARYGLWLRGWRWV